MNRELFKKYDERPPEESVTAVFFIAIGPGSNMRRIVIDSQFLADYSGELNELNHLARDKFIERQNGGRGHFGGHELYAIECARIDLKNPNNVERWGLECRLSGGGLNVEIEPEKK